MVPYYEEKKEKEKMQYLYFYIEYFCWSRMKKKITINVCKKKDIYVYIQ